MDEPVTTTTTQEPAQPPVAAVDPFALDENSLSSLGPEQRAALDPILDGWKKKASETIQKRETEFGAKYKPLEEKAQALDKLTNYKPFVEWWGAQQKTAANGATPQQREAIGETKPADIATPQEWQEAIWESSNGNPDKLQAIQARMFATWATPMVQKLREEQTLMRTEMAVKDIFERHTDAKDLDMIGIDPTTREGVSLLEICLDWAERNGRSLEEGYQMGKRWVDNMSVSAQQKAMGLVNEKKQGVTAGPSTSTNNGPQIVEVENQDELMRKSMEAQLSGNTSVRFVIRRK